MADLGESFKSGWIQASAADPLADQPVHAAVDPLLDVANLAVHFKTPLGVIKAVDGVSFQVKRGETLAIVGESGSGKSVTSLAIMGLLPLGSRNVAGGDIFYQGKSLLKLRDDEMAKLRGSDISMIFQEPMTSLNPVYTIGMQISEAARLHLNMTRKEARDRAEELLVLVGISEPRARLANYPHELSGGMRQRVMIAMALVCNPKLLIADEPTTALDVTIQAQILDLIRRLQADLGMSVLFITHDLGVVAEMADRVVVMYSGRTVEEGPVETIMTRPMMPYTMGLLNSIPTRGGGRKRRLDTIPGNIPNPLSIPAGCAFHPRCRFVVEPQCVSKVPEIVEASRGHMVCCLRFREIAAESVQ